MREFGIYWLVRYRILYSLVSVSHLRFHFTAQNDNLQIHEEKSKGVYVKNLSDYYVSSAREVYEIMRQGGNARVVSSTSMFLVSVFSATVLLT